MYRRIDDYIESQVRLKSLSPLCKRSCDGNCCSHNFHISQLEFSAILRYLLKNFSEKHIRKFRIISKNSYNQIEKEDPTYIQSLHTRLTNDFDVDAKYVFDYTNQKAACPFLADSTCKIYEMRPFICRWHGIGYVSDKALKSICDKYDRITNVSKDDFVDIGFMYSEIEGIRGTEGNSISRGYPIFYFLRDLSENDYTHLDLHRKFKV